MSPYKLIDLIIKHKKQPISKILRKSIMEGPSFRECAKNYENNPEECLLTAYEIFNYQQGGCPDCGGRRVWRQGVHFDNQMRCVHCGWSGVPK